MAESFTCSTETKDSRDASSTDYVNVRTNFHVFNNGRLPLENLNSNSSYRSNSNGRTGDFLDHGFDPELSFGFTFKKIGAGLENLGNTCFLNSVLQCLTYTEPFVEYLQSGRHKNSCQIAGFCAMCAIQNHVSCALQSTGRILAPEYLVTNIRRISRNFRYARQEDAHEYMVSLLESMHKCCLPSGLPSESPSAYEKSLVHKIFGGFLRSQVKCTECLYGSNKYDPFLDLSLEIHKAHSLREALVNFTAEEQLDGGEKQYQCQGCKQKVRAVRRLTINKAPYVLTIHLKRFGSLIPGQKINKKLEFGPTLDLRAFVSGSHEGDLKYTLYGVLVHAGASTHSGHYYCYVRTSTGVWYVLDDNEVLQVEEGTVLAQRAYMLFYVRNRRALVPKKPVDVVQKENLVVNHMETKETIQIGLSTRGSSLPVCPPIFSKVDVVASCSAEGSMLQNSFVSGDLMEGPIRAMDSGESSLKVLDVLSVQHSTNNHTGAEGSSQTASSVVEGGHLFDASSGAKAKATDEQEEAQVARKPDSNNLREFTSRTSSAEMEHETESVTEIMLSTALSESLPLKASSIAESDGTTSHPYAACNNACTKVVNRFEEVRATNDDIKMEGLPQLASAFTDAGIVSHPTSAKTESIHEHEEIIADLTVSVTTLPECNNVLLEFASTPSATNIENEDTLINETEPSNTLSKSMSQTISSVVEGGGTISHPYFGITGAKEKATDEHDEAKTANSGIMAEVSLEIASSVVKGGGDNTSLHTCDEAKVMTGHEVVMEDMTVPVATHLESNIPQEATYMEHKNAVLNETVQNRAESSELGLPEVDSVQLSSLPGPEETQCRKATDAVPTSVSSVCLSSQSSTCIRVTDLHLEKFDSILMSSQTGNEGTVGSVGNLIQLSNQLGTKETLSKRIVDLGHEDVGSVPPSSRQTGNEGTVGSVGNLIQLSNQLGIKETLSKRIVDLGHEDVGSVPPSSRQGAGDGQASIVLEGKDSNDENKAEENGLKPGEVKSSDTLTPSRSSHRSNHKEAFDQLHCQKVLKANKHLMAHMNFNSSRLFRAYICMRRNKKLKKNRRHRSKYVEVAQKDSTEDFMSGMEASTSEKTSTVSSNASPSGRRQGNSGANNHDHTAARDVMNNHAEPGTVVELGFMERISHNATLLGTKKAPMERSSSALTTNSSGNKDFDSSQDRNSVRYFVNMLTRGSEETTVGSWCGIGSHPSKILNAQSMDVGYISDKWDAKCDSGRRKRVKSTKNGLDGANPYQETAAGRSRLKKARMDQCSSGDRPYRI